jgi:hypothetical protein
MYGFVITSILTGFGTGYLYLYGDEIFIPKSLLEFYGGFLPIMFIFLGVFIVVVYTGVFPALNLFLNEEKTMWILRHLPLSNETIIYGKTAALSLCFITTIPFVAYISIFIGSENILFLVWFLIYSYIASLIISIPLGVKYVGKKSDIMLLYSVSMLLFLVLGFGVFIGMLFESLFSYYVVFYLMVIAVEILVLYASIKISSSIYYLKYNV